jgi:alpha-glucosidase
MSVSVYFPKNIWYDFWGGNDVLSDGGSHTIENVGWRDIPLYIKGGSILVMRMESAMTLTEVRGKGFFMMVCPGLDNMADGELYIDDGESLEPEWAHDWIFHFDGEKITTRDGPGAKGLAAGEKRPIVEKIIILGQHGQATGGDGDGSVTVEGSWELDGSFGFSLRV